MIDYFAIGLTHGLLALAAWRLMLRDDLDTDDPAGSARPARPWSRRKAPAAKSGAGNPDA